MARHAYNLVLHKKGPMLYEGVVNMLVEHLSGVGRSVAEAHDATLLQVLRAQWDLQRMILKNICDILMYMVRFACVGRCPQPMAHV